MGDRVDLSSMPALSTEEVPGQYTEKSCFKEKENCFV